MDGMKAEIRLKLDSGIILPESRVGIPVPTLTAVPYGIRCSGCGLDLPYLRADWDKPYFVVCLNEYCKNFGLGLRVPLTLETFSAEAFEVAAVMVQWRSARSAHRTRLLGDALARAAEEIRKEMVP